MGGSAERGCESVLAGMGIGIDSTWLNTEVALGERVSDGCAASGAGIVEFVSQDIIRASLEGGVS